MAIGNTERMHKCFPKHSNMRRARMKWDKETQENCNNRGVSKERNKMGKKKYSKWPNYSSSLQSLRVHIAHSVSASTLVINTLPYNWLTPLNKLIPLKLLHSHLSPFPLHRGTINALCQSIGTTLISKLASNNLTNALCRFFVKTVVFCFIF